MVNKILYRKLLFEQKHKQRSKKYYTENDYLSQKTNNGQQNTIQKTTFEQKHKQRSKKYYTENDYLSKNTNNGQQNTIQKTTT
jgi:membrane-bound inhibitor of C-type lysozyme